MRGHRKNLLILLCAPLLLVPNSLSALTFSGNVLKDFPQEACFDDPGVVDVGVPIPPFPAGTVSGFDVDEICLLYDKPSDTLYVGALTFSYSGSGLPIIFGDADGDGDPGGTSATLAAQGGEDHPDLADEEFFSLIFDFDSDFGTDPEVIAGLSAERQLLGGFRVSEVALPHPGVNFSLLSSYYGAVVPASSGSAVFQSPSSLAPHLEFTVTGFSVLPGFPNLQLSNPDETIGLIFKSGSIGDDGIGDEDIQIFLFLKEFFDQDGDNIPDAEDNDSDNDGIPNPTEQDLDGIDTDGDCHVSSEEAAASGLDTDGDGDIDANDGFVPTDTDGDGTPDYLDTDADGDTILDIDEADNAPFDDDGDRSISPEELADIDNGGNYPGGNGNGCLNDNDELPDTDNDGVPDYRDPDTDGDGIPDSDEAGDADPQTPPVDTDDDGTPDYRDPDSDGDGLNDDDEINIGTDPKDPDSDDDGILDGDDKDPLFPGDGIDPDVNIPNSGEEVQFQGSGFGGCSLIR